MQYEMFTKENLWSYIKTLASEFRKRNRNLPYTELIIVGGSSILLNYSFREATTDVDAYSTADTAIYEAAKVVANKLQLNPEWINSDFTKTESFSNKLREVSKTYAVLNHGTFEVRTVASEYLIAMKLRSNRFYKNDFSDIVGIICEEKKRGNFITFDQIMNAYSKLYSDQFHLPEELENRVQHICSMQVDQLEKAYKAAKVDESTTREELLHFDQKYKNALNKANVSSILHLLKERAEK